MTIAGSREATVTVDQARPRTRRLVPVTIAALLILAVLAIEARSLLVFHAAAPWSSPNRIHYCGRNYDRGGLASGRFDRVNGGASLKVLMRGPLWQPIYGQPTSSQERSASGGPCAMSLYMKEGSQLRSYSLSGGP